MRPELAGGGMHIMGPRGHLDVHVDFNLLRGRGLHRRLNIIVYLTEVWDSAWEGCLELWDPEVKECEDELIPLFNRCVVFNTTQQSFHGVRRIRCPAGVTRNSFASYYYTSEPPEAWDGEFHDTIYRARPGEFWRGAALMPLERLFRRLPPRIVHRALRLVGREP